MTQEQRFLFHRDEGDVEQGVSSKMETRGPIPGVLGRSHRTNLREREVSGRTWRCLMCRTREMETGNSRAAPSGSLNAALSFC